MTKTREKKKAPIAPCALCTETKELCRSHIIPDSYFRKMKQQSNGLLVEFDTDPETVVKKGIDSWWEYLLCKDCEKKCEALETRWIPRLREAGKKFTSVEQFVPLAQFEYHSFRRFMLSVLWRSSVSKQPEFGPVRLTPPAAEVLRAIVYGEKNAPPENVLAIRVRKIFDATGAMSAESFEHMVMAPRPNTERGFIEIRFMFAGYVIDFAMAELNAGQMQASGYALDRQTFDIPAIAMVDITELMHVGVHMLVKKDSGMTSLN